MHGTDPRWIFPRPAVQIPSVERLFLPPMPWCLLVCITNKTRYLLLTAWTVTSVITLTSAQHRLALRTPADSLAAATHANVRAAQALHTMPGRADTVCSWSLTPQIKPLLRGCQSRSQRPLLLCQYSPKPMNGLRMYWKAGKYKHTA